MDGTPHISWAEGNLETTALALREMALLVAGEDVDAFRFKRQRDVIADRMETSPALARIAARFGLDDMALKVLTLIALADQPPALSAALQAHNLSVDGRATRALVCEVLGEGAEEALAPGAPLLASTLVSADLTGRVFEQPLTLCRPVLEFLQGRIAFDLLWSDLITAPLSAPEGSLDHAFVARFGSAVQAAFAQQSDPIFFATGPALPLTEGAAALIAEALGVSVMCLNIDMLPAEPRDRAATLKAMRRDLALSAALPILKGDGAGVWDLAQHIPVPVVVLGAAEPDVLPPNAIRLAPKADGRTAADIWQAALTPDDVDRLEANDVAQSFRLQAAPARRALAAVQAGVAPDLWHAARTEAGGDFDGLAQQVVQPSDWDDLVLPPAQQAALGQMAGFLRNRSVVNDQWGFADKSPRGLGMAALFYGDSGTGKTTAAEALVARVQAETAGQVGLYRVNVAALVSKYIGETSKNFRKVFEAGAASGAALLFDEAEGLFGRRSTQNRESLDKHSNAELGFLLQCLESYPGIAILTTNLRQSIDDAFFRRFRFAVEFPFPGRDQRALIWQRVLPDALPKGPLDFDALSGLSLSGGNIRSVAVNGAYMAASDGGVLEMRHLAQAVRLEFAKLEKPLPERDIARWLT